MIEDYMGRALPRYSSWINYNGIELSPLLSLMSVNQQSTISWISSGMSNSSLDCVYGQRQTKVGISGFHIETGQQIKLNCIKI